ncbi:hypothetical protein C8P66_12826 [Humitalea rosea]|uniref:Uncharacterized protein n=1 Tax=Humitalea rosea TaxID=990373 RepID=A0A2W7IJD0_9PROT|nr:hypothetical protein [Humitalea rosea]PZW39447.1 hypothetical protein C8P66_12826 [Humitalea rosea]
MLDTSQAKEFALAHWLTAGASGRRLFVRVFDGAGNVREDIAGDGAEHLRRDVRSGGGDAAGGGDEAAGAVSTFAILP